MKLSESRGEAEKKHMREEHFEHEVMNVIESLNHKGGEKAGPNQYEHKEKEKKVEEEEDGVRVITISGSNVGATMKTELDNNHGDKKGEHEDEFLTTYVNSNFQAVNNSLVIGANYETHDPGVHLDISGDDVEEKPSMKAPARGSRVKKGKSFVRSDRRDSEHTE